MERASAPFQTTRAEEVGGSAPAPGALDASLLLPDAAQIQELEGTKLIVDSAARDRLPERLSHLWLDAGYTAEDKGVGWVGKVLGWTADLVRHPQKLAPEQVMRAWVRECNKEGVPIDAKKVVQEKGPRSYLPKRWIVDRTLGWLAQNRRMSLGTTRGCRRGEKPSITLP